MKLRTVLLAVAGIILCSNPALAQVDQESVSVLGRYTDAYNNGDVDGVMATFAEDATIVHGRCTVTSPCNTPDAIRAQTQLDIGGHLHIAPGDVQQDGDTLIFDEEIQNDAIRAAGLERILGTTHFEVRRGQVIAVVFQPNLADAQTAAFISGQQAQPVPESAASDQ